MDQCDDCGEVVCASCSTLLSCKFCGGGLCEECATACGRYVFFFCIDQAILRLLLRLPYVSVPRGCKIDGDSYAWCRFWDLSFSDSPFLVFFSSCSLRPFRSFKFSFSLVPVAG